MFMTAADEAKTIPATANVWEAVVAPWSCLATLQFFESVSSNPFSQTEHSCESFDSQFNQLGDSQGDTVRNIGFWRGDRFPVSNVSNENEKLSIDSTGGVFKISFRFRESREAHLGGEEPPL